MIETLLASELGYDTSTIASVSSAANNDNQSVLLSDMAIAVQTMSSVSSLTSQDNRPSTEDVRPPQLVAEEPPKKLTINRRLRKGASYMMSYVAPRYYPKSRRQH